MSAYNSVNVIDDISGYNSNGQKFVTTSHLHRIIGEVEMLHYSKVDGVSIINKTIDYNDLLVNGSVFMTEKNNNARTTFRPTPIDVDLGVHNLSDIDFSVDSLKEEVIIGLVFGIGGCSDSYSEVKPVQRHHKCVPDIVPCRTVPVENDLSVLERTKYFLRAEKTIDGKRYACYYGKRFEESGLKVLYEDGTDVPVDVDLIPNPKFIEIYSEYKGLLNHSDMREWFRIMYGSTKNSRINSVGLVTGYPILVKKGEGNDELGNPIPDIYEYGNVRCITTLNVENQELKDSSSSINFTYRLLII